MKVEIFMGLCSIGDNLCTLMWREGEDESKEWFLLDLMISEVLH